VVNRALARVIAALLALAWAGAQAAVGALELPARGEDLPVTVFYPTAATAATVQRGPFQLTLAWAAAPARGNGRLVVLSHGSGGNAWAYTDLASRLVEAGFVVAVPLHRGDNYLDGGDAGPAAWKRRPLEAARAIDAVGADARFAPLLSLDRVGMFGMSAGGHTALALAGGRWSPAALRRHCEAHLDDDFQTCVGTSLQLHGDSLDAARKTLARLAISQRLTDEAWYGHTDPRFAAIVAEVPFAVDFDPASLAHPQVALGLVRAGRDAWLPAPYHLDPVRRACQTCVMLVDLPNAGHGSLLSPQPVNLKPPLDMLMRDPPGFDRALVAPAHAAIVAFMRQHLLP
jgi:predicted dienelactone hydrolase